MFSSPSESVLIELRAVAHGTHFTKGLKQCRSFFFESEEGGEGRDQGEILLTFLTFLSFDKREKTAPLEIEE